MTYLGIDCIIEYFRGNGISVDFRWYLSPLWLRQQYYVPVKYIKVKPKKSERVTLLILAIGSFCIAAVGIYSIFILIQNK